MVRSAVGSQALAAALASSLASAAQPAGADTIECSFTEPFAVTTYDTDTRKLTVTYDDQPARNETLENLSLVPVRPGVFELRDAGRQVVQRLEWSYRGSDGMSDHLYPYSVHWLSTDLHGGCTAQR